MTELPTDTITFLFTDVEGSTRLLQELGDRNAAALAEHRRPLRDAFTRRGGVEVDTQGTRSSSRSSAPRKRSPPPRMDVRRSCRGGARRPAPAAPGRVPAHARSRRGAWGAAAGFDEAIGRHTAHPVDAAGYNEALAAARAACGEETFDRLWAEGKTLSTEEAAEYALAGLRAGLPQ